MKQIANVVIAPLQNPFSYSIPEALVDHITIGSSVEVPFGKRKATGYVIDLVSADKLTNNSPKKPIKLKDISSVAYEAKFFLEEQLELFNWVADYYGAPLANVIEVAIPAPLPPKMERIVNFIKEPEEKLRGSTQNKLIEHLKNSTAPVPYSILNRQFKNCLPALRKLSDQGLIELSEKKSSTLDTFKTTAPDWAKKSVELNTSQKNALAALNEAIEAKDSKAFLLHGITGSGKTEVYIEAIQKVIANGQGALIIVPEIALTPQLVDRFIARIGEGIAVLHSGLSKRLRWDSWCALIDGRCKVAIGARSGIFAPVPDLGLIIVDEEHDGSYKQSDGLRYNARDIAVVRSQLSKCPVVLGSATPSLESFHNALKKKYTYLSLPGRHSSGSSLTIDLVDLNAIKPWEMPASNVSSELHLALKEVLARKEQAFILYNKRGFASFLQCDTCGAVVDCPNCSVTLTYHQKSHTLQCHYCNLSLIPGEYCTECKNSSEKPGVLTQRGAGTEKIFDELQELFPEYKIDRLDRDVAKNIETYEQVLDSVRSGETQILVGTQMIAKGHDLPGVTLVGIVSCDIGLHMPDFRSSERVFQLLTQASGRAGRGKIPGRVLLQTRLPKHISIRKTLEKDFAGFAKAELTQRKELQYPPYGKMLRILVSSQDESAPFAVLEAIKSSLLEISEREKLNLTYLGPSKAPLYKLKANFRWHLLIKSPAGKSLHYLLNILKNARVPKNVRLTIDRDPQDLL